MHFRASLPTLAAATALLASATTATAATPPVSMPRIAHHFDLAASQQPENITRPPTSSSPSPTARPPGRAPGPRAAR
ncbi:hypothetical protein [Streptomyces iakyrus]|uniref:hypothetical protein n=1 Tax=Streptomyces iakyrus TaxID=68219 RepID=UPI0033CC7849